MPENPLKVFEENDPELLKLIENTSALTFAEGALPKKFKLLIAMALESSHGTVEGVKSFAQQAMQAGATKNEIMEALRVAHYISGVGTVYTAAPGFKQLF